jgi:hypothetical protein
VTVPPVSLEVRRLEEIDSEVADWLIEAAERAG